ncbi:ead/Ea22-like family protein [Klebsiella variicola subsp. variicola]|uniref:ead/Ea22-like family protein n=1 Tax=Klebsiella variicola TaxID=244366 RepID=UPI0035B6669E
MTDITELAQRMKTAAEKATQGEWWADEVKNEGCYGSGDDCVEGFTSYAIYGSDGQTLFDSLNSDAACISEEYDGEGHVAWDETAQRNAEFIALANPANILALVEALEKAQRANAAQDDHINQQQDRIESLEKKNAELGKYAGGLESFRTAYMEWSDKTDWVQKDKRFDVLKPWGKHRADVLKEYIQHLESRTVMLERQLVGRVDEKSLTTINPAPTLDLLPKNAESLTGNSPAQSDCCPAQNSVAPAQSPIDHGYRPECECSGCKATARICDELSANSSANPDCWCRTCRPVVLNDMRFVVCPDCGNKRCPRANDHRNACTGSNEPGQEGSAYPADPQEVPDGK